jgi:hypothetical protein
VTLRSHYGFESFYCEPGESGAHEKGGVEGEVGRFRRTHLVPVPHVRTVAEFNCLLAAADRADERRHIAGRLETVSEAAAAERPWLRPLPEEPFDLGIPLAAKVDRKARLCVRQAFYFGAGPARRADDRGSPVGPLRPGVRRRPARLRARAQPAARLGDAAPRPLSRDPRPQAGRLTGLDPARPGPRVGRVHGRPRALLAAGPPSGR